MTTDQVIDRLKQFGSLNNSKIYKRHGAKGSIIGVSLSQLKNLKKEIGRDHELALQLWNTAIIDCQILAVLIANPKLVTHQQALTWINHSSYYILSDILINQLLFKTNFAQRIMHEIILSEDELVGRAGWKLLENFAHQNTTLSDAYFIPYLQSIQANIHNKPNRIKEAMNHALIAIGCRNENLEKIGLQISRDIGKVCIDHGKTSCKTPNASIYITNCRERKQARILAGKMVKVY